MNRRSNLAMAKIPRWVRCLRNAVAKLRISLDAVLFAAVAGYYIWVAYL